jgi:hypothetical protein
MPTFRPAHSSPYARLVANVTELGECWVGTERSGGRGGYVQASFRVPGLGGRIVKFSAHILTWVAHETGAQTLDELYLAYLEFRHSGLVLDHTCVEPACRRPLHLEAVTQAVNIQRGHERRAARLPAADRADCEF